MPRSIGEGDVEPEEFKRRLERVFEAAEGPREDVTDPGPVGWFVSHRLVGVNRNSIYHYLHGRTPIPDRIVAVLELLEQEHGVADD